MLKVYKPQYFVFADTGIDVEVLLKMFQQYEDKGHSASRQKATMTLVENYTSEQRLEQEKILKVVEVEGSRACIYRPRQIF